MIEHINMPARRLGLLNLDKFCHRCFWIRVKCEEKFPFVIPFPGIFSSIDGYSKRLIHAYFDSHQSLPPWFPLPGKPVAYVDGLHYKWFSWDHAETNITLRGTPDDIFRLHDDSYHIVDYKTAVVTDVQDELYPVYETQLRVYAYVGERLMQRDPLVPVSGLSLLYMEPQTDFSNGHSADLIADDRFSMHFKIAAKPVQAGPADYIPALLFKAREMVESGPRSQHTEDCRERQLLERLASAI